MKTQEKSYQLIASYVKRKYFISTSYKQVNTTSTSYKQANINEPMWCFETVVWGWDNKTKKRCKMLEVYDHEISEEQAIENHCAWAKKFSQIDA